MKKVTATKSTLRKSQIDFIEKHSPKLYAMVLQNAVGDELVFPKLNDSDSPSIGDYATIDGEPASGEYVMPEGETYVFKNGTLTEIIEDDGILSISNAERAEILEKLKKDIGNELALVKKILGLKV